MVTSLFLCAFWQATFVVDDNGGAGVDFTDLPPAIAAAADGDRVLVRAGSYTHFELAGKGLVLLGDGASTRVENAGQLGMRSTIADLPRGSHAYLEALTFTGLGFQELRLEVRGATTRAALKDVTIEGPVEDFFGRAGLNVDAAEVVLQDCAVLGGHGYSPLPSSGGPGGRGLFAHHGARVLAFGTQFLGGIGAAGYQGAGNGGPALALEDAFALFADCEVRGGGGAVAASGDIGPGGPALVAQAGARSRFLGGPAALIASGAGDCPPTEALQGTPGTRIVVHGLDVENAGSPFGLCSSELQTSGFVAAKALPVLTLDGSFTPSGTLTVSITGGPPLAPFVLLADRWPAAHGVALESAFDRPYVGEWFVTGGSPLAGQLSPTGDFTLSFPASQLGAGLRPFALQARVRLPNGRLALTGGVLGILR